MVLQSKIVPPATIEGDSVKKTPFWRFLTEKKIEKKPKVCLEVFLGASG